MKSNLALPPAGEAGHLLWVADPSQPDLGSRPTDLAEALTLREQQGQIEVGGAAQHCVCFALRLQCPWPHELRWRPLGSQVSSLSPGLQLLPCCLICSPCLCWPIIPLSARPVWLLPLQVVFPGAYRCVCVEVRLSHLAVNAVLEVRCALLPAIMLWQRGSWFCVCGSNGAQQGVCERGSYSGCRRSSSGTLCLNAASLALSSLPPYSTSHLPAHAPGRRSWGAGGCGAAG
jgi:hypothetical protein